MTSLDAYALIRRYWYCEPNGERVFAKERYELLDPLSGERTKTFRYWDPSARRRRKPYGADAYLYRLPEVTAAIERGDDIHWAEGEKDADALVAAGVVATSHHQGAGRVDIEQASWLAEAPRVVLWVDVDRGHYEVGAYDAVLRHNLLIDVGLSPKQVRFVRARRGKDAADHLSAGLPISRAVAVDPYRLADVASAYAPAARRRVGYRDV